MLAKKTVKNQITLPKAIVDRLPKTDYFEVSLRSEEILLRPVVIVRRGIGTLFPSWNKFAPTSERFLLNNNVP